MNADLFFDVMTRLGEASLETVEAEVKELEGIHVSVATPRALYRLKKGTVRPLRSAQPLAATVAGPPKQRAVFQPIESQKTGANLREESAEKSGQKPEGY